MALTELVLARMAVWDVPDPGTKLTFPHTSQSPAVRVMLVQFAAVPDDTDTPVPVLVMTCPTCPETAVAPFVTP